MDNLKQLQPMEKDSHNKMTTDQFIAKAKLVHGDLYDYSKVIYKSSFDKVEIICMEHGSFLQRAHNHRNGKGCPECGKIKNQIGVANYRKEIKMDITNIVAPDGCMLIPLSKEKYAIVDIDDFDKINQFVWAALQNEHTFYATTNGQGSFNRMHRMVMGVTDPKITIDHIDHNGLNNSKSNLRACTQAQNNMNKRKSTGRSSKYKGVSFSRERGKWVSSIKEHGKNKHLGRFDCEMEAAKAYDAKAIELHGEFADLNFK